MILLSAFCGWLFFAVNSAARSLPPGCAAIFLRSWLNILMITPVALLLRLWRRIHSQTERINLFLQSVTPTLFLDGTSRILFRIPVIHDFVTLLLVYFDLLNTPHNENMRSRKWKNCSPFSLIKMVGCVPKEIFFKQHYTFGIVSISMWRN